jgi:uncharacterized OsmC-like protein
MLNNGINLDKLNETVNAIKSDPQKAQYQFRVRTQWVEGGRSKTTIKGFYGMGREDTSRSKPFVLEADEPPILAGGNTGPNAVETLLASLAECMAVGFVYNAAVQDIKIEALDFSLEGDIDLRGFLGLSETVRPGYKNIKLTCHVKADAPQPKLQELWNYAAKTSPVLDILRNPVPVTVKLEATH